MKKILFLGIILFLISSIGYGYISIADSIREHLRIAKESQLENIKSAYDEYYRFLIIDGGFRASMIVTVYKDNEGYFISHKQADSYYVGKDNSKVLEIGGNKSISKEDWQVIVALVKQSAFWTMREEDEKIGFDGSFWVLQGCKNKLTHQVVRWEPDKGAYRKLCLTIWKLSGSFMGLLKDDVE